ncbi:hypothetical protein DWV07_04035 [Dickeya zeae]|nr:hypothetical protein DWV07_04035 [Dickeya zeae]
MWQSSNFLLLAHCFSPSGLVFNRTIILMREINICRRSTYGYHSCDMKQQGRMFHQRKNKEHYRFEPGVSAFRFPLPHPGLP